MSPPPRDQAPPGDPDLPRAIGPYRIQRVLGTGGMATVYAALQERPRRTVAVKVLKAGARTELSLRRFRREVEILGRLRHPFIAQVYEAGTHLHRGETLPYLVMEYVPRARTLIEHVAAEQLDLRARLRLFTKVCAAVEHGHRHKVIHRDLKPGNILIDESGQPKVIDFGVARAAELDAEHQTTDVDSGRIVGTIQYMSPEQLDPSPRDLDARCDVYALGVILYKLLTGRMPYELQGLPVHIASRVICEDEPGPPSEIRPEVRGDLETIILKALHKDPAERYANAGNMGRDVLRYLASRPIHGRRPGAARRLRLFARRHRVLVGAAAIVVLVIGGAGAGLAWISHRQSVSRRELDATVEAERERRRQAETALRERAEAAPPVAAPRTGFSFAAQEGSIGCLAFDAAGGRLISGAADHSAVVWSIPDRAAMMTLREHDAAVVRAAFARSGGRFCIGGADGSTVLLDAGSGRIVRRFSSRGSAPTCLSVAPDGRTLAVGRADLTLRLVGDGAEPLGTLRSTTGALGCAAFDETGRRVAAGSAGGTVYVWSAAGGERLHRRRGDAPVVAVAFVAGTNRLAACDENGAGAAWSITGDVEPILFRSAVSPVAAAAFDPTGRWLVVAGEGLVEVRDATAPSVAAWTHHPRAPVTSVAIDAEGRWCAGGGEDGRIEVWPVPRD